MPEGYATSPTPLSARIGVSTGVLRPTAAAAQRRAALTTRAQARPRWDVPVLPGEGEPLREMQAGLIPDVQALLDRDWGEWWETMSGGIPEEMPVSQAGVGLIPAIGGALAPAIAALPAVVTGGVAAAGLGALGAWAGGLFDGGASVIPGTNIPLGGPFLPEPPAAMIAKEWNTGTAQFYQLIDGRIAVYSKKKGTWKAYRPAKHIVVSRNPRMGTLLKASRRIDKLWTGINKKAGKYMKKKVVYGIPPSRALSPIEKAAIRG